MQDYLGRVDVSMDDYSQALLDSNVMQELQDRFCRAQNVYAVCFSRTQGLVTKAYGSKEEHSYLYERIDMGIYMDLMNRLISSDLESVVEADVADPHLKCCGVAVRIEDSIAAIWVVMGVIADEADEEIPDYIAVTSEERFYHCLEFLESLSKQFLQSKLKELFIEEKYQRTKEAQEEVELQLKRNEAVTSIVQQLESDEEFSVIVKDILQEVCTYLDISSASLLRYEKDNAYLDVICEYVSKSGVSYKDRGQHVPREKLPFATGKPYIISAGSMKPVEFETFFQKEAILAGVSLPIEINGKVSMYVCFVENTVDRTWENADLKFLNDVKQIIQSILSKRIAKNSLASSYASLEAILENVGCGIYVTDRFSGKILFRNQTFRDMFQNSGEDVRIQDIIGEVSETEQEFSEIFMDAEDGWYDVRHIQIHWVDGREVDLYTIYDITAKKKSQQEIERQANNDYLTGLYNRRRCEEDLAKYIAQCKEFRGNGALLYMDLDDFKHINDGLGHQYGDVLLRSISHCLQNINGIENTCYRMGGDEFTVILPYHQVHLLDQVLDEIRGIFAKPWYLKDRDSYCSISIGVVRFPESGDDVQDLIKKADIALYEAKRQGKNTVVMYDDKVELTSFRRIDMEKNLREAVINGCREFEVYYQPVVNIQSPGNPCHGAEALIRWNSENLGMVSPVDFIPLAEYLRLINPIGDFILEEACKRCKYWNDYGHPEYRININLSVVQLLQNDIAERIRNVIRRTQVKPTNITLEVTESLAISDMTRMKKVLAEIKKVGVWIALDDFGTGYSSLNHIRELPIDIIKIDRCFVVDIGKDEYSEVFVKMVTELSETLGVQVCVEGVEEDVQFDKIREMNVQFIQGYYFDKPMTAEAFEAKYLK